MDKLATSEKLGYFGKCVSAEGIQRNLLPQVYDLMICIDGTRSSILLNNK